VQTGGSPNPFALTPWSRPNGDTILYQAQFEPGGYLRLSLSNFVEWLQSTFEPSIVTYDIRKNDQRPVILEWAENLNELIVSWQNQTPPTHVRFNHFETKMILRKGGLPPQPIVHLKAGYYQALTGAP